MVDPDERLKHIDLIQPIVARLATNSFLIKGWALTIAAAFFALMASHPRWLVAAVGFVPVLVFWGLDGVFLRQERMFRLLYDDVRRANGTVEPLSMDVTPYRSVISWWNAVTSPTLAAFYGVLVGTDALLFVVGVTN